MNLNTMQARFENYVLLTTSRATAIRYARALSAFFDRFTDKKDPSEFTRVDIEDYKLFRRRDGVTARTINYELQIVRAFWNWMLRMEVVSYNPLASVKRLREIEPERVSLTADEQQRVYETAYATGEPKDALLVSLALSTGLRAETMWQLEKSDIDFDNKVLRIAASKMKAGRNHAVPLRDDVMALLEGYPDGRLFADYAGSGGSVSYHFNKLLRRSGVSLRGMRSARRSFATSLLRSGADLRLVQDLLGHKNIVTTSRYLTSADASQTREAVERLPKLQA